MPREEALRQRLLFRIRRRYETVTKTLEFGPVRFDFTRVADPDAVLDQVAEQVDLHERLHGRSAQVQPMHLPYWAELWDSASGIGAHLAGRGRLETMENLRFAICDLQLDGGVPNFQLQIANRKSQMSASILDLGCGMGLAGTVAAALGAQVLFADLEQPALLFARLNSLPWRRRVRTRQLDWQRDRLDETFDLILGADILYEKAQWPFLEPFWRAHLKPGGSVLLGEPGRATGDLFIDWITQRGWILDRREQPVSTRPKPIRLLEIRPCTP